MMSLVAVSHTNEGTLLIADSFAGYNDGERVPTEPGAGKVRTVAMDDRKAVFGVTGGGGPWPDLLAEWLGQQSHPGDDPISHYEEWVQRVARRFLHAAKEEGLTRESEDGGAVFGADGSEALIAVAGARPFLLCQDGLGYPVPEFFAIGSGAPFWLGAYSCFKSEGEEEDDNSTKVAKMGKAATIASSFVTSVQEPFIIHGV